MPGVVQIVGALLLVCSFYMLLLGSWYGLLVGLVPIPAVAIRAVHEERTLRSELPGYEAYANEVKHRMIPSVW